ncbi:MAG: glycosyltransferase family 4 protein [Candidatus Aenigmatarchaeota archaeon]
MRKILFFNQCDVVSGQFNFLSQLVENWKREDRKMLVCNRSLEAEGISICKKLDRSRPDIRFEIFNAPTITEVYSRFRALRYIHVILRPLFLLFYTVLLFRILLRTRPDVVVSNNGGYPAGEMNLAVIIAAKLVRIKRKILIIHNYPKRKAAFPSLEFFLDKAVSFSSDVIVTVSRAVSIQLNKMRAFSKRVIWIHNGISTKKKEDLPPSKRYQHLGISKRGKVIGFIGVLEERKGLLYLAKALPYVLKKFPNTKLIIIGKGDEEYLAKLKGLCESLGIEKNVIFTGHVPNALQFMECFNVLVLPSIKYESFGLVILEAMLYKKPVIVTSSGGMKEVVIDKKTGFIINPRDDKALADKISYMFANPDVSKKMGKAGYQRLINKFTIETMVNKYYELI